MLPVNRSISTIRSASQVATDVHSDKPHGGSFSPARRPRSARAYANLCLAIGGDVIVRVNGIVYDKEKGMYKRVGYKTEASLRFFVLHNLFRRIGFVDWAKEQGDNFIFRRLASRSDPGDVASKRVNRLLKKAGAIGMNIEVAHSLRHGAKDMLIEEDVDDQTTRLQMGHESDDVHSNYGERSALRRKQCQELAHFELPKEIDWSMFEGRDFEAMASRPRAIGRPRRI
jgi:hypothetical protein